jgi:ABC-2 type transport system permease protein
MILRYLKVWTLFWVTSLSAEIEYRINFALATLSSLANLVGNGFGLFLFYRGGYQFAGWRWEEALIILGIFTFLQGISQSVLNPNMTRIVQLVQQGTLDFVLLKPLNSQFWLSVRVLSPWGIPDMVLGILLVTYAGILLNLTLWDYFSGILTLFLGVVSLYSIWFVLGSTSIWFVKISNVTEVLRGLLEAGRFPIEAYPPAYRLFFTYVVPVVFLTTVPAEVFLGRGEWIWILGSLLLAMVLLLGSHFFWRFALRFYTSASS